MKINDYVVEKSEVFTINNNYALIIIGGCVVYKKLKKKLKML